MFTPTYNNIKNTTIPLHTTLVYKKNYRLLRIKLQQSVENCLLLSNYIIDVDIYPNVSINGTTLEDIHLQVPVHLQTTVSSLHH